MVPPASANVPPPLVPPTGRVAFSRLPVGRGQLARGAVAVGVQVLGARPSRGHGVRPVAQFPYTGEAYSDENPCERSGVLAEQECDRLNAQRWAA